MPAPPLTIDQYLLSPNPRIGALEERLGWFARHGVRECWLVHQPAREVEVLQFASGAIDARQRIPPGESIRSGLLPRFDPSPDSIFDA